jgi:glycosyltransferase involved in cell wall biosynthesis
MKPRFSIVIPIYNRPDELHELLESLCQQTFTDFEVVVVEDGSSRLSKEVALGFSDRLSVFYYFKQNEGQGFARNYGFERANGDYFVVFDSDTLIPPHYLETVDRYLTEHPLDLYGGNDAAHPSFSALQKAISYSMTSFFTTGGIRGKAQNAGGKFEPRSFNMGMSRELFEKTGGFARGRLGEDIEFSIRVTNLKSKVGLIPGAHVFHKRRGTLKDFFKQVFYFGRVRWALSRDYPDTQWIKAVHWFPALFVLGCLAVLLSAFIDLRLFGIGAVGILLWALAIGFTSTLQHKSLSVGLLSIAAAFVQLSGYGLGFWKEFFVTLGIKIGLLSA